jgi:hypothetical protein
MPYFCLLACARFLLVTHKWVLGAGEDLCDCDFSLAYGGRILLSNATLRLKVGSRYGLCGPNGAGKTTLMKAIANGQVDGFPPREEVLTVYVAHDIQAQKTDPMVLDYLANDPQILVKGVSRDKCLKSLQEIGFDEERLSLHISALSGPLTSAPFDPVFHAQLSGGITFMACARTHYLLPFPRSIVPPELPFQQQRC